MPPKLLRCVQCSHAPLEIANGSIHCTSCGRAYPRHSYRGIPVLLSDRSPIHLGEVLKASVEPKAVDLAAAQRHWKTGGLSTLLKDSHGKVLLNYGSGDGGDRLWLESQGYDVTTFDIYPGDFTDFICDGHELPFSDSSFDVVTSTAVFEHLYNPFQAAAEIYRVLRNGGTLVGSVAFLEPFHANSYFHMSHLGLTEIMNRAGFREVQIHPGWSCLEAINGNYWIWNQFSGFRKMSSIINRLKFAWGRKLWKIGYASKGRPLPDSVRLGFSGSLLFKAVK